MRDVCIVVAALFVVFLAEILYIDEPDVIYCRRIAVSSGTFDQYPNIRTAFNTATERWSKKVSVVFTNNDSANGMKIRIRDIKDDETWAFYREDQDLLVIDPELENAHMDVALSVIMHEIGHSFGLPHIVDTQ